MRRQIGQSLFIGLSGPTLTKEEAQFIVDNNIGGVTLFGRNCETPEQIHQLCSSIYALTPQLEAKLPLWIAIDMEGGRVHRLKSPFTQWPALARLNAVDSTAVGFRFAQNMGAELRSVGINMNFAPCLDVLSNPQNTLIGDRAISTDPEAVAKLASALVRGYIKSEVAPVAKHFPGHGNTLIDSHEALPVEELDLAALEQRELIPFRKAFRARLDFVMTAHILFSKIDAKYPVTLSPTFISELLRKDIRFRHIIITDDLDMKALTNEFSRAEIPVQALKAGCDILLYCNEPASPPVALDAIEAAIREKVLTAEDVAARYEKLLDMKRKYLSNFFVPSFDEARRWVGHPEHQRLAEAIAAGEVPEDLRQT